MTNDCAPTAHQKCAYPPCARDAVAMVRRPYVNDDLPLCAEHRDRALALIEQLRQDEGK